MAKYQYRRLEVGLYDKHDANREKRRGGREPDRYYTVGDTGVPKPVYLMDEVGDDRAAFEARAHLGFIAYLDALGGDGWQVVFYTLTPGHQYTEWPQGTHLLMRQAE